MRTTYDLSNVFVAGRRLSGSATGSNVQDAVRRFVAREARKLKVDVAPAIMNALKLKGFSAEERKEIDSETSREADALLPEPSSDYTEWPAMRR